MESRISEEDNSRFNVKALIFVIVALFCIAIFRGQSDARVRMTKAMAEHDRIMSTTDGTGLVRVRHVSVKTPDGNCSLTVQRYERRSEEKDLFSEPPRTTTLECSKGVNASDKQ